MKNLDVFLLNNVVLNSPILFLFISMLMREV